MTFVGAVWADQWQGVELGNRAAIDELKAACAEHRLAFVHLTHVSEHEQLRALRAARLTPALAGAWQVEHGYLPCRAFKLPSYGCAMFTNVSAVNDLFGWCVASRMWCATSPMSSRWRRSGGRSR